MACIVMAEADAKAKEELVEKVGSASTWGWKERNRFNLNVSQENLDPKQLLGEVPWFDFKRLGQEEFESNIVSMFSLLISGYMHRRKTLKLGTESDFLEGELPNYLTDDIWCNFRSILCEIYVPQATPSPNKERKRKNKVGGRKEAKKKETTQPAETPLRQVSKDSTLSYGEDSAGGGLLSCAREVSTNGMATAFFNNVLAIWGASVPFVFAPPYRNMELSSQRDLILINLYS